MFLKKGTLRILYSDIFFSNFFIIKDLSSQSLISVPQRKISFKNLANLEENDRKNIAWSNGVLEYWNTGVIEEWRNGN